MRSVSCVDRGGSRPAARRRRYGAEVREALIVLWEASDRLCSKRLKPLIPVLLPALERHGRLWSWMRAARLLLAISAATMDRLLRRCGRGAWRSAAAGRLQLGGAPLGAGAHLRRLEDPPPGYVEVDLVAHCGTSTSGSFVQTMVLTDVATGWTECVPVRCAKAAW